MKRKLILSSVLTIILALSLIAGSTLALFTSQSQVNISVATAKVNMMSIVEQKSLELYSLDVKQETHFENGGTAEFTDAAHLVLENVTPGDKAVFDIVLTNESTVDIQYQIAWSVNGTLAGGLVAKADGQPIVNRKSAWTLWETPLTEADKSRTISVSVELPIEAGNEYQEGTADITFSIIAVQGNGTALYVPVCDVLATPETIDGILAEVAPGTVIGLSQGKYGSITLTQDNLTLVSNAAVVDYINLDAHDYITLDGITFDAAGAKPGYYFKGGVQIETDYATNLTGDTDKPTSADYATIRNCTFTGTYTGAKTYFAPVYINEVGASTSRAHDLTVEGCTFECGDAFAMLSLGYMTSGTVTISSNVFEGKTNHAISASGNSSDWLITGNSFLSWNDSAIFSSTQLDSVWNVVNNTFKGADGKQVFYIKSNTLGCTVTANVSKNTVWNNLGTIVAVEEAGAEHVYCLALTAPENAVFATTEADLTQGGYIILADDIVLTGAHTVIEQDTHIDLNGHTISSTRNYNGENTSTSATLHIKGAETNVTISGSGAVINEYKGNLDEVDLVKTNPSTFAVYISDGAALTIMDGIYKSFGSAVYVGDGSVNIQGGFFESDTSVEPVAWYKSTYAGIEYVMFLANVVNCNKGSYNNGKASVEISGGTYVNENPSNLGEGWGLDISHVDPGYKVTVEAQANGDKWYTVVAE